MSGWVITLLVGFLFFVLAGLAVFVIWLWLEADHDEKQRRLRQTPKIVIRQRRFKTNRIVERRMVIPQPVPTSIRSSPPAQSPPPIRRVVQPAPPPAQPQPAATQRAMPQQVVTPSPGISSPVMPPSPAPAAVPEPAKPKWGTPKQSVQQQTRARVIEVTNRPKIANTRFKLDFDTICKRTGRVVRNCKCRGCREMRADAGI